MTDAKIQLSKIVKLVKTDGPQLIKFRGDPCCAIISYDEYKKIEKYLCADKSNQRNPTISEQSSQ